MEKSDQRAFRQYKKKYQFLITGSARLDYYRRGGDSLQGRYHYYRLHPLSLFEINPNPTQRDLETLLAFGGFPEPFFKGSKKHWQRWQNERQARVIHEDLLNLERVREISQLDLLQSLLPARAGSILSINSIKEDLSANHESVERWIQIFENLYVCYRIPPFLNSKIRSAKKEKKLCLWDWSLLESPGGRFENLVASNLLKYCHLKNDTDGEKFELSFFRDSEKREIDFIVSNNKKPIFAVECKTGDQNIADNIKHFSSRLQIPQYYQVHLGSRDYVNAQYKVRVMPFLEFSKFLGI